VKIQSSTAISLLAAATLLAGPAYAADPPEAVWPSEYQRLSTIPGGASDLRLVAANPAHSGDVGEARGVPLPFDFPYQGSVFSSINVGSKGYVTFGSSGSEHAANRPVPDHLLRTTDPKNLIAAWWGDHLCHPERGVRTATLGAAPHRAFVIEWDGCSKKRSPTDGTATTFEAQVWLWEGGVIRVMYGKVLVDPAERWSNVSWGLKPPSGVGRLGPDREGKADACDPLLPQGPKPCGEVHFPSDSTIQYGLSAGADLAGRVAPGALTLTPSTIELQADTVVANLGQAQIDEVIFDLYLSTSISLAPGALGTIRLGSHTSPAVLGGGERRTVAETWVAPLPPVGRYRVCAHFDPAGRLAEWDRTNNFICSLDEVGIGPDLVVASISAPAEGMPAGEVSVPFAIRNDGNLSAPPFSYRVWMKPVAERGDATAPTEEVLVGRVDPGLAPGEERAFVETATLPSIIRGASYVFELELDILGEVPEATRVNNRKASSNEMINHRPKLEVGRPTLEFSLPEGCFYGEPIEASFEVCNTGSSVARNFHVAVVMGEEAVANASYDLPAAAFPPFCGTPGSPNHARCEPIAGREPICAFEFCRLECASDADCAAANLRCREDALLAEYLDQPFARSCMNELEATPAPRDRRCQLYSLRGNIPLADRVGDPYEAGEQRFHFVDDAVHALSSEAPDDVASERFLCRPALPDLAVEELALGTRLVRGKLAPITRRIRNLGFVRQDPDAETQPTHESFAYRYYLSKSADLSVHQIELPMLTADGAGRATIGRKDTNLLTDLVSIPSGLAPGPYHLGIILDPLGELVELDKENNVFVFPEMVDVEPERLEIVSDFLPRAIVGARYRHAFVAAAGTGPYVWSATNLPPGLTLDASGELEGIPTRAGTYALTVRVSSGGLSLEKPLALQVREAMGELEIATRRLPVAVRGAPYAGWYDAATGRREEGVRLAANGGEPPYRWELDPDAADGRLPEGLQGPTEDGWIRGQATPLSQTRSFRVRVTDALGHQMSAELELEVVGEGTLRLGSEPFEMGLSGEPYSACIDAAGGDGGFEWEVEEEVLPQGLAPAAEGQRLCLLGTPTACGNFEIPLRVRDGQGQVRAATVSLSVECGLIRLDARALRPVARGEAVEFQLRTVPSDEPSFRLIEGRLPKGLDLEPAGRIVGVVAEDASYTPHDAIVEMEDAMGRRSLAAITMRVEVELPEREKITKTRSGCSSAGDSGAWLFPLALGLAAIRRSASGPRGGVRGPGPGIAALTALLAVGIGSVGCGEEPITSLRPLCEGVVCEEGFTCDEAIGICTCGGPGGVTCAEGEICAASPSPHCTSPRCEHVECERGQSCHPETGLCHCGGESCGEDEICVEGTCVDPGPCAGVSCGPGSSCDPEDGSCSCGEARCEPGESCVDGVCTLDRCAGVRCANGSICSPADGVCHCGGVDGPICNRGEACVEEEAAFACKVSERCADVVCEGGTVCDPDDGRCRCGGVGEAHPICLADESCIEGVCRGGELCAPGGDPVVCQPGMSCDPLDGVCKCGGRGGAVCGAGEVCSVLDEEPVCTPTCRLLAQPSDCEQGEGCYYDGTQPHGSPFCFTTGTRQIGAQCAQPHDCARDLHCNTLGFCTQTCDASDGPAFCRTVAPNFQCVPFSFGETFGYCTAH